MIKTDYLFVSYSDEKEREGDSLMTKILSRFFNIFNVASQKKLTKFSFFFSGNTVLKQRLLCKLCIIVMHSLLPSTFLDINLHNSRVSHTFPFICDEKVLCPFL